MLIKFDTVIYLNQIFLIIFNIAQAKSFLLIRTSPNLTHANAMNGASHRECHTSNTS